MLVLEKGIDLEIDKDDGNVKFEPIYSLFKLGDAYFVSPQEEHF